MQSTPVRKIRKASDVQTPAILAVAKPSDPLSTAFDAVLEPKIEKLKIELIEEIRKPHQTAPLQTTNQLAAWLNVCPQTVMNLVKEGLPFVWVLDSRRFDAEDVKIWLATREREQKAGAP